MVFNQEKFSSTNFNINNFDVKNFSDYDLDYLRMQIKRNSDSLEKAIENLKKLANKHSSNVEEQTN